MELTKQVVSLRWKDIPSYEDLYEVSNTGIVRAYERSGSSGKDLKQHLVKGYLQVWLSKENKVRKLSVHRAVLMAFDRIPNDGEVCNHKDGNRTNNHLDNLEWCTREENERHKREELGEDSKGEKNGNYGYIKSKFFPSQELRNRLIELGVPRNRHDIVSLGEMLPVVAGPGWVESVKFPHGYRIDFKVNDKLIKHTVISVSEADARAKMLIYLLENNLLTI